MCSLLPTEVSLTAYRYSIDITMANIQMSSMSCIRSSSLYSKETPCYFQVIESPSSFPYSKSKVKVSLSVFFRSATWWNRVDASLKTKIWTSKLRVSGYLLYPYDIYSIPSIFSYNHITYLIHTKRIEYFLLVT